MSLKLNQPTRRRASLVLVYCSEMVLLFCVKELSSGSRSGVISRDNPLHVDHINRFWDRFSAAMKDKDLAIQAELSRQVFHMDVYSTSRDSQCSLQSSTENMERKEETAAESSYILLYLESS